MAQGLCFAVPASTAAWVVSELLDHGRVRRAYLGVAVESVPIPSSLARRFDLVNDHAALVLRVEPKAPADKAGVREGDLIVAINGRLVTGPDELTRLVSRLPRNTAVEVTIVRGDSRVEVSVFPG
jgi:S1-C subfamily serine protease